MPESVVQVTEGTGKKLHTFQRTVGANTVEDEFVTLADTPWASYAITTGSRSTATAGTHLLQVMAGITNPVYLRRVIITQSLSATTAAYMNLDIVRLSTAGTGGTAVSTVTLDTTDAASGATAMTSPTTIGTVSNRMMNLSVGMIQTIGVGGSNTYLVDMDFDRARLKPIRIPAGVTNGIAIRNVNAVAGGGVMFTLYFSETTY